MNKVLTKKRIVGRKITASTAWGSGSVVIVPKSCWNGPGGHLGVSPINGREGDFNHAGQIGVNPKLYIQAILYINHYPKVT